jgi:hemoglobin-like flavoprotein
MDHRQIELVQQSFAQAERFRPHLIVTFYSELFAIEPSLKPLFKGDMELQRRKLAGLLKQVIESLHEPEALLPEVRALAMRHVGYGVQGRHYDLVGKALLRALKHELGAAFTDETRAAWGAAYQWLAGEMRRAAYANPAQTL